MICFEQLCKLIPSTPNLNVRLTYKSLSKNYNKFIILKSLLHNYFNTSTASMHNLRKILSPVNTVRMIHHPGAIPKSKVGINIPLHSMHIQNLIICLYYMCRWRIQSPLCPFVHSFVQHFLSALFLSNY